MLDMVGSEFDEGIENFIQFLPMVFVLFVSLGPIILLLFLRTLIRGFAVLLFNLNLNLDLNLNFLLVDHLATLCFLLCLKDMNDSDDE